MRNARIIQYTYPPEDRMTHRGEQVKSYGELSIANYLFLNNIAYYYEPTILFEDNKKLCPDFMIPANTIIEYWGMKNKKYKIKMKRKKEIYQQYDLRLISVKPKHLTYLEDYLDNAISDRIRLIHSNI